MYVWMNICMYVCMHTFGVCVWHTPLKVWRSENNFWELIFSFHHVGHQLRPPHLVLSIFPHWTVLPASWKSFNLFAPFSKDPSAPVRITFSPPGFIPRVVDLGLSVLGEDSHLTFEAHWVPSLSSQSETDKAGQLFSLGPSSCSISRSLICG